MFHDDIYVWNICFKTKATRDILKMWQKDKPYIFERVDCGRSVSSYFVCFYLFQG